MSKKYNNIVKHIFSNSKRKNIQNKILEFCKIKYKINKKPTATEKMKERIIFYLLLTVH